MAWYLWLIVSIVVGFGALMVGAKKDFIFESDWGYYGFIVCLWICCGGFFHGWFKLLGW